MLVIPDGSIVYAAAFHSGNRTTTLNEGLVCDGGAGVGPCTVDGLGVPGGLPLPNTNFQLVAQPEVGLIVRFDGTTWRDELGRSWNNAVRFTLPDKDVFYCASFGGAAGGVFRPDTGALLQVAKAQAEGACP